MWIPFDPEREDAAALSERMRTLAAEFRDDYRAYVERHADAETVPADPDARVVLIQHVGLVGIGTTTKEAGLSRDLYHRAIEVMARAHALGGFTSLTENESFGVECWPLELYKLSCSPRPASFREGGVGYRSGAAVGRAVVAELAAPGACILASTSMETAPRDAVGSLGEGGGSVGGDVTTRPRCRALAERRDLRRRGHRGVQRRYRWRARIESTTLAEWERIRSISDGLLPRRSRGVLHVARSGPRRIDRRSRIEERVVARKHAGLLVFEGHRATPGTLPRGGRGPRRETREHDQPRRAAQGSRIWDSSWREERGAAYGIESDELEEPAARAPCSACTRSRRTSLTRCSASRRGPFREEDGQHPNVDGGVYAAYPR